MLLLGLQSDRACAWCESSRQVRVAPRGLLFFFNPIHRIVMSLPQWYFFIIQLIFSILEVGLIACLPEITGFQFGGNSAANAPIPVGTLGAVLRIDSDGDIYVDFGAALNSNKMIRTAMFDHIEAAPALVRICLV